MTKQQKRRRLAHWLTQLLGWKKHTSKLSRVIQAEPLEKRELMAVDAFLALLGSTQPIDIGASLMPAPLVSTENPGLTGEGEGELIGEGEPVDDLVAFAKAIAATTTKFYGADWCAFCTQQKELFQDGAKYLPYIEVTNPDHTINAIGTANNITSFPTWVFPDGSRESGVVSLATIAQKSGVAIPKSESVYFSELGNVNVGTRSPLHIPIDGYSPTGRPITYTVTSSNPSLIDASVSSPTNRSLRITAGDTNEAGDTIQAYGEMVFELFEDKAPRPAGRVIQLAEQNFYDGLTFHRIAEDGTGAPFVIQGGDPQGTGSGGSSLGNFDDQYHLDLLHNRSGVLSYAKSSDDTNNSQFFITASATRFLDFNHSVFGTLIEGDDVRQAIQRVPVDAQDRPTPFTVRMTDVSVFQDTENGVLLLKPVGTGTGTSNITVTGTDDQGRQFSRTFVATVVADSSNGAPFLNDIPTLQATAGVQLTHTLTSQDRENDAVTYSVTRVGNVDYPLSVNAQTGVVTLTPPAGFTGNLQFRASVTQAAPSTTSDKTDSQLVTVNVGASSNLILTLAASSDTGQSNSDGLTNATSLTFNVAGTTSGSTVEILSGASVVGTATATSTTTQVPVNASSLTGNVPFTARQITNGQTGASSPVLTLNLDRTAPAQISASAVPASATLNAALNVDLQHPEEGPGLAYALENAPTGMTIVGSSGVISWTPLVSQLGAQTFTLVLTDAAGNVTRQPFSLTVIQEPRLKMKLATVSTTGTPITSIQTGQEFKVQILLADQRQGTEARGAFSAYADLLFDAAVIRPIDNSPINHIAPYRGSRSGTVGNGIVDEVGAIAGIEPVGPEERVLAEITFVALASGNASLRLDPADDISSETTLYGDSGALAASLIDYGIASIAVGANFQVADDVFNFDEDAPQQTLNVLSNDTAGSGVVLTIVEVSAASRNGTVTIAGDGKSLLYTPAPNVHGGETFTYTVANAQGVRQTATVTVQLTDINDPPVANNDTFTVSENSTLNTLDVLANDTKGNDQSSIETLTVTQVGPGSANGTIQVGTSGLNVRYTPRPDFTGTETFTYTLSDGRGGTSVGTVFVLVNPQVPPPTAVNDSFNIIEDAAEATFDVLANDTPANAGDTLTISEVRPSTNGSTVSIFDNKLRYRPAANLAGQELITYVVQGSNGGIATGTVTFSIENVNDPPTAVDDSVNLLSTSGPSTIAVLANDTDPDIGDTLTISAVTQPPAGSGAVAVSADGQTITYTPPSDTFEGTFTFSYTIRDAAGLTSTASVNVTVDKFTPRNISGKVVFTGDSGDDLQLSQIPLTLTGTSSAGATVSQTVRTSADGSFSFDSLAPGNYMLKREAIPFLNDPGQQVNIVSAATDGNHTTQLQVTGSLLAQYVDVRDFLGSTFKKTMTAVVKDDGSTQWVAPQGDWADLTSISFQLSTTDLTVNAANATTPNLTATIPFTNQRLSRATSGDQQLIRLRGNTATFNLATTTTPSNGSGEGEASTLNTGPASTNSSLVGEGEASATPVVTTGSPVSVNEPALPTTPTSVIGSSSNNILQAVLGSSGQRRVPTAAPTSSTTTASAVDEAMKDVQPTLQRTMGNSLLHLIASSRRR